MATTGGSGDFGLPEDRGTDFDAKALEAAMREYRRRALAALEDLNS